MKRQNYLVIKVSHYCSIVDIDYNKLDGFRVRPLNSIEDGVLVNRMTLIHPSFIEKVLKRKIKIKLESFLKFIISLLDDDGSSNTSISDLREALNSLSRYKSIVISNYQKYLDQKYVELLLKKIALLENELKMRIIYYKEPIVEEKGKAR